jgi:O-methyltransferase domain
MIPTLESLRRVPTALVREFMEINYNPLSLAVLRRALEIGLVDQLPPEGIRLADLPGSARPGTTATSLEMTVRLGAGFRLFELRDDRIFPGILTSTFLSPHAPMPLRGVHARYVRALDAVGSLREAMEHLTSDDSAMYTPSASASEQQAYFANRQAWDRSNRQYFVDSAAILARAHADRDMSRHRTIVDVGAGPATFLCILKSAFPHLRAIAADVAYSFAESRREIEALVAATGAEVELLAHNFLDAPPLPDPVDLLTLNRLISGIPARARRAWLARAYGQLEAKGVLAVVDFFETGDPDHDRTVAMLFALAKTWTYHRLKSAPPADVTSPWAGEGWTAPIRASEVAADMVAAGFEHVSWRAADAPFAIIEGRRP